jgi:hypothetical protein
MCAYARENMSGRRVYQMLERDTAPTGLGWDGAADESLSGEPPVDDEQHEDYVASVKRLRELDPVQVHFVHDPEVWTNRRALLHGRRGRDPVRGRFEA